MVREVVCCSTGSTTSNGGNGVSPTNPTIGGANSGGGNTGTAASTTGNGETGGYGGGGVPAATGTLGSGGAGRVHRLGGLIVLKRPALSLICMLATIGVAHAAAGFAGYQASGSTYTSVSATIRVPSVSNSTISADNRMIAWIGIEDGTNLAQVGMSFSIDAQGVPSFGAFYEMFPAGAVPDPNMGHIMLGGDVVRLTIKCTANCIPGNTQAWGMTVKNVTRGWTWAPSDTLLTSLSKFDIMTEDLNTANPIPNFGTITFTNISVNGAAPELGIANEFPGDGQLWWHRQPVERQRDRL